VVIDALFKRTRNEKSLTVKGKVNKKDSKSFITISIVVSSWYKNDR
jgi:hypothetical protein